MLKLRKASERGHFDFGWLQTYHTFSFGEYVSRDFHHFKSLRVINEDFIHAGQGFATHSHRDMEIITYLLQGQLEHKDSMGNGSIISAGEVQYMSAGSGVTHSEFNPSKTEASHLLQIWIFPKEKGLVTPRYDQKRFPVEGKKNALRPIATPDGRDGSIAIRQDSTLYDCFLEDGKTLDYAVLPSRGVWIQVISGSLKCQDQELNAGDGVSVENEKTLRLSPSTKGADFLLFELA